MCLVGIGECSHEIFSPLRDNARHVKSIPVCFRGFIYVSKLLVSVLMKFSRRCEVFARKFLMFYRYLFVPEGSLWELA